MGEEGIGAVVQKGTGEAEPPQTMAQLLTEATASAVAAALTTSLHMRALATRLVALLLFITTRAPAQRGSAATRVLIAFAANQQYHAANLAAIKFPLDRLPRRWGADGAWPRENRARMHSGTHPATRPRSLLDQHAGHHAARRRQPRERNATAWNGKRAR